jgi:colanic acid/amylovoran biosynthesis glycosyltransferase
MTDGENAGASMSKGEAHSNAASSPLVVAYLVNVYPAPSHSFIRREILGLEKLGCRVMRFSVRHGVVTEGSEVDQAEMEQTRVLLGGGVFALLASCLWSMLTRPLRFVGALCTAVRVGWRSDRGLLRHFVYLAEAAVLMRSIRGKAELVHAHFGTNSTMVAMLCRELGGPPFSFTAHGPEEFERPEGIGLREKVAKALFVVGISDFGRSQLWRFLPVEQWSKAKVVRCGVDHVFLGEAPAEMVTSPELVWVGRFAPQKGIPLLLEACRLLHVRGVAFRLTLVGGGPLEGWLQSEIASAGLEKQMILVGWKTAAEIGDQIDRSRGMVVASFAEGLPVVIMEAMARARPVVTTRIAGIPELVEAGRNGWVVSAGRADDLADAMSEMLQASPQVLEQFGAAARRSVERNHDAQKEASRLLEIMRAELGRAGVT